jgi:hypothetical protein
MTVIFVTVAASKLCIMDKKTKSSPGDSYIRKPLSSGQQYNWWWIYFIILLVISLPSLKKEVIFKEDIENILGRRPYEKNSFGETAEKIVPAACK